MKETGVKNTAFGADKFGFKDLKAVHWNLTEAPLVEESVRRGEAELTADGALTADTGQHTGRSPKDKFVVIDAMTKDTVWWDNNGKITPEQFNALHEDFIAHATGRELFAQDLYGGADPAHRIKTRVYTELAWHSLFIRTMLIRPERKELASFTPELTIVDLPSFKADPKRHGVRSETIIAIDFSRKIVLIGNSSYAGEMKKSVFTTLNYYLPGKAIMPMHCSANVGSKGDSALFFGLSGTGKTTLSADAARTLIGDDETGWSPEGIFNFEGGCYAKTINLSAEAEPEIFAATNRFGSVLENVPINADTRLPDFTDQSKTENTRSAYPLHYIPNASKTGRAGHPKNIIMLAADAFGVMPPIAKLTPSQAMYHFLSGYTAKVAGTEKGLVGVEPEFSTCFGSPFLPRHPTEYGQLLKKLIAEHKVDCWLVNSGWTSGIYGVGHRMPIKATRALVTAALDGSLKNVEFRTDPYFGFAVPVSVPGVDAKLLDPSKTWADPKEFDETAKKLVRMFQKNFEKFEKHVDADIRAAQPEVKIAAE
ncbi:phosphoenolpyruvate carboxykinase [ATP] [Variibacter gotjawalensis]|uniref:Phosphoenolpyruvate carboxykinase (ATP) n=1 Tax=Variibacter gotjawalensis TaxID=1333996 RepID=A0A0S3PTN9_9BRAD|nr:phosphoenolpyruvate carboxykinase [Variibacter gotjawalensis]RZS45604.1 phosphoenolpyruvate carboxykinase (ATP) [Variibacter gotjawalensis]BAT59277.1 phosphoenolpyruvate carboxykinase [ATP] [Variibacter gotjawalensis]